MSIERVAANGIEIEYEVTDGHGADTVLIHGFPHTKALWSAIAPALTGGRRVIAPDLRGAGGTTRAESGYDAASLAADLLGLLDALEIAEADVVAIDAGVPGAFLTALHHPDRVRSLAVIESTLGTLPGAEAFFARGAPWWFGLHQVPDFAEHVVAGHEGEYLDFFYRSGTFDGRGIDPAIRDEFVAAYTGAESLRCAFEIYRAMPASFGQLTEAVVTRRLTVPTLAVGAQPVGDTLYRQLLPVADDLRGELVAECGHIVPLDRPDRLLALLRDFWT